MPAPVIDDVRLSPEIAAGAVSSPMFSTRVVVTGGGAEQRIGLWAGARRRFAVSLEQKTPTELAALLAFWKARQGRLRGFRFKDWSDYATGATKYDLVELTATTFQLVKRYVSGAQVHVRTIYLPVVGTVQIWDGVTEITSGFTVDHLSGVVTFTSDPAYQPSATFEFDVPARFDMSDPQFVSHWPGVQSWDQLSVIELVSTVGIEAPTASGYRAEVLAEPSLLAYYEFDSTIGVLIDSGPNGYDLTGAGYTSVPGIVTEGIDIGVANTLNHPLTQPQANTFQGTTGSLELWAKYRGSGTNITFVTQENGDTPAEPLQLTLSPSGPVIEGNISPGGVPTVEVSTSFETASPDWEHFVYTWDGAGDAKLYKDGVEVDTATSTGANINCPPDSNPMILLFGGDCFLDEVAWYSDVLSPARVLAHYNAA